ncbi:MAG: peptide ABC transporter substrate-binding protein [Puniceicoccales bacterium]|jgi:oligopeptide transport system substrate-binding protein|nr:peptide ABC transporter substrate-binding protein [Puniceicoccales bacterium]
MRERFIFPKKTIFGAAILAVLLLAVAAAVKLAPKRGDVAAEAAAAGILIINNSAEPVSLDPHAVSGASDLRVVSALFEGLLANDPETLVPRPALAERFEVSRDGRCYTFHLRAGLRWSDGAPLTAEDFLFSFRRVLSPRLGAPNAAMFFAVKNAKTFYEGKADFSSTGFSAPAPLVLRVELARPLAYFPSLVCHPAWAAVPRHAVLRHGTFDEPATPWTRPENIAVSGPFHLKVWRVADRIELARNPLYHAAASVRLKGARFLTISDLLAEERAFRGGLLHITGSVPPMKVAVLREKGAPELRLDPFFSTTFVRVNTRVKPLDDPRVRRALSLCLHRSDIAQHVMRAGETPAFSLTPPSAGGYVCTAALREDAVEARRLLAEAGYPGGKGFPVLSYLYNTHETSQLIAQALQEMWRRELGISVELASQEWKVYKHAMASGDYQLCRSAWSGDYHDPASFLELFDSQSEQNQTGWADAAYDAALDAASGETGAAARLAHFQRAEARLLEASPVIPLAHNRNKFLIRPEVRGWFPNALDIHPLGAVWLEVPLTSGRPQSKSERTRPTISSTGASRPLPE